MFNQKHILFYLPSIRKWLLFFLISTCCISPFKLHAKNITNDDIRKLDDDIKTLSSKIYAHYSKISSEKFDDIQLLEKNVRELAENDHISAIILIRSNINIIENNIDDKSIFYFMALLLKYNEWNTANHIYKLVQSEGEKSLISNINFTLAKYYLKQKNWQTSIDLLTGIFDDLEDKDTHYAYLINGISLQHLKKHRAAIELFKNIPLNSKFYSHAQLNTAIAYIRQGWWTDAHIIIKNLLANKSADKSDEIINRLYLVLGYSLLQKEYYRDSRNAFRNIGLKSTYTNKALLGIALTAANQEDHISALNALSILKKTNTTDLSVDESYLLIPYVYKKINQNMTASASYTEAMEYYEKRITEIETTLKNNNELYSTAHFNQTNSHYTITNNVVEFTSAYPRSFLDNLTNINALITFINLDVNPEKKQGLQFHKQLKKLQLKFRLTLSNMLTNLLNQRKEYLKSYLSQSRYGLARLYDNNNTDQK